MTLKPMLAQDIDHYESKAPWGDPAWAMEPKLDGIRLVWSNESGHARYYARSGNEHTGRYPWLDDLPLPAHTVLDGELCVPQGMSSDATALKNRERLVYVVFDVATMDGHDLRPEAWSTRRQVLELDLFGRCPRVGVSMAMDADEEIADRLIAEGHEGVVLKRRRVPYKEGIRSWDWLKRKAVMEMDAVITDCDSSPTKGSLGDKNGWQVLSYGFYIEGRLTRCGSVGQSDPREIQETKVGKVAVIRCNAVNKENGALRHPRIVRFRTDKRPEECVL